MRSLMQNKQIEAEEQRRRLEADDSKQRALKDMMNSMLEFRKKDADAEDVLVSLFLCVCVRARVCVCLCVRACMHACVTV